MTKTSAAKLLEENSEFKRELHSLRCRYGDLADLVSEVACDYEAGKPLTFIKELVACYRKQQSE